MRGMRYQPQGLQRPARSALARGLTYLKSNPGAAMPAAIGASSATAPLSTEVKVRGVATRFTGYGSGTVDMAPGVGQSPQGTVLVLHQSTVLPPNGGFPNPGYSHILAATSGGITTGNGWLLQLANGTGCLSFRMYNADTGADVAHADGNVPLNDGQPHITLATWGTATGDTINTYVDAALHVAGSALTQSVDIAYPMRIGGSRESQQFWGKFDGNIYLVATWNRVLSPAEIRTVSANPWQLFEDVSAEDEQSYGPIEIHVTGAAATVVAAYGSLSAGIRIAGSGASTASAACALSTTLAMSAAGTAPCRGIAALSSGIPLSALASSTSMSSAALSTVSSGLVAASASASRATAGLSTVISLLSSVSTATSVSAVLSVGSSMDAAAVSPTTAQVALATVIDMAADVKTLSRAVAVLEALADAVGADAICASNAHAALATAVALAAAAGAVSFASADLQSSIPLVPNDNRTYRGIPKVREYVAQERVREI